MVVLVFFLEISKLFNYVDYFVFVLFLVIRNIYCGKYDYIILIIFCIFSCMYLNKGKECGF